jgi:hypothetical protein
VGTENLAEVEEVPVKTEQMVRMVGLDVTEMKDEIHHVYPKTASNI